MVHHVEAMRVVAGDVVHIEDYHARRRLPGRSLTADPRIPSPSGTGTPRWLSRVARGVNAPITRGTRTRAAQEAVEQHRVWVEPPLDAQEQPVVLIGGLAGTVEQFHLLEGWLSRLNCHVRIASIGSGVDCGERTVAHVTGQVAALVEERGQRCVLIG